MCIFFSIGDFLIFFLYPFLLRLQPSKIYSDNLTFEPTVTIVHAAFNHKRYSRVGILIISLSLKPFFWTLFLYPVDVILISGDDNTFLFTLAGLTNSPSSSKDSVGYA